MNSIAVERLSYTYVKGRTALVDVSLTIATGESVGLVGPNGAGKTTLFLALAGVIQRPPGTVRVAGLDPAIPAQRKQLPSQIGLVFQDSDDQLFNATVFDEVAFGPLNLGLPEAEVRVRVAEALLRVGLSGFETRVPFHLSGGEKRRVALAGVLAMRPGILLLDEPSTHLDPRGRRELIRLIQGLSVTSLIASHDLELILDTCTRCILLDNGQVVRTGPTRELLADAELMDKHGMEVPYSLRTK